MRTLYAGAGLALAAGLLLGAAMKPRLAIDGAPAGPQVSARRTGESPYAVSDEAARIASYGGHLPAYVLGADWQAPPRAAAAPMAEPTPAEPAVDYYDSPLREDLPQPPVRTEVAAPALGDRDERVAFPSIDGGTANDAAAAAKAPPPEAAEGVASAR